MEGVNYRAVLGLGSHRTQRKSRGSRLFLPLLWAGVGDQNILLKTHREWCDLACISNGMHEVEKKIKVAVYLTKVKQGKSDIWKQFSTVTGKMGKS